MNSAQTIRAPEWYAADFIHQLHLNLGANQKCERTCLLWSKEHWANEAKKAQLTLQQLKDQTLCPSNNTVKTFFHNAQFLNTIAQVYGRMFGNPKQVCDVRNFDKCPYISGRQDLLKTGCLADAFVTLLHKATRYALLEKHPIDSGLLDEKYDDVYGIDLTNFEDLQDALVDGRFETMYQAVLKRAKQLTGLGGHRKYW